MSGTSHGHERGAPLDKTEKKDNLPVANTLSFPHRADFDLNTRFVPIEVAQAIHAGHHDDPSDTLWVETCRRRPCRDLDLPPLLGQSFQ